MSKRVNANGEPPLIRRQSSFGKSITFLDFDDVDSLFAEATLTAAKPTNEEKLTQTSARTLSCQSVEIPEICQKEACIKNVYYPSSAAESDSEILVKHTYSRRGTEPASEEVKEKRDLLLAKSESGKSLEGKRSYYCQRISSNKRGSREPILLETKVCTKSCDRREPVIIEKKVCSRDCGKQRLGEDETKDRNYVYCRKRSRSREKEADGTDKEKIYTTRSPPRKKSDTSIKERKSCCPKKSRTTNREIVHETQSRKESEVNVSTERSHSVNKKTDDSDDNLNRSPSCCSRSRSKKRKTERTTKSEKTDSETRLKRKRSGCCQKREKKRMTEKSGTPLRKKPSCCSQTTESGTRLSKKPSCCSQTSNKSEVTVIKKTEDSETKLSRKRSCCSGRKDKKRVSKKETVRETKLEESDQTLQEESSYYASRHSNKTRNTVVENKKSGSTDREKRSCCGRKSRKGKPCPSETCPSNRISMIDDKQFEGNRQSRYRESFGKISKSDETLPDLVVPRSSMHENKTSEVSFQSDDSSSLSSLGAKHRTCSKMDVSMTNLSKLSRSSFGEQSDRSSASSVMENPRVSIKTPSESTASFAKSSSEAASRESGLTTSSVDSSNQSDECASMLTRDSDSSVTDNEPPIRKSTLQEDPNATGLRFSVPACVDGETITSGFQGLNRYPTATQQTSTTDLEEFSYPRKSSLKADSNACGPSRISFPKSSICDCEAQRPSIRSGDPRFSSEISPRKSSQSGPSRISFPQSSMHGDESEQRPSLRSGDQRLSGRTIQSGASRMTFGKTSMVDDGTAVVSGQRPSLRSGDQRMSGRTIQSGASRMTFGKSSMVDDGTAVDSDQRPSLRSGDQRMSGRTIQSGASRMTFGKSSMVDDGTAVDTDQRPSLRSGDQRMSGRTIQSGASMVDDGTVVDSDQRPSLRSGDTRMTNSNVRNEQKCSQKTDSGARQSLCKPCDVGSIDCEQRTSAQRSSLRSGDQRLSGQTMQSGVSRTSSPKSTVYEEDALAESTLSGQRLSGQAAKSTMNLSTSQMLSKSSSRKANSTVSGLPTNKSSIYNEDLPQAPSALTSNSTATGLTKMSTVKSIVYDDEEGEYPPRDSINKSSRCSSQRTANSLQNSTASGLNKMSTVKSIAYDNDDEEAVSPARDSVQRSSVYGNQSGLTSDSSPNSTEADLTKMSTVKSIVYDDHEGDSVKKTSRCCRRGAKKSASKKSSSNSNASALNRISSVYDDDGANNEDGSPPRDSSPRSSGLATNSLSEKSTHNSTATGLGKMSTVKSFTYDDQKRSLSQKPSMTSTTSRLTKMSTAKSSIYDDNQADARESLKSGGRDDNSKTGSIFSGLRKVSGRKSSTKGGQRLSGQTSIAPEESTLQAQSNASRLTVRKQSGKDDVPSEGQTLSVERPSVMPEDQHASERNISNESLLGDTLLTKKPSNDQIFPDEIPGFSVDKFELSDLDLSDTGLSDIRVSVKSNSEDRGLSGIRVSVKSKVDDASLSDFVYPDEPYLEGDVDDGNIRQEPEPQTLTCPCKCCQSSKYSHYRSLIFPHLAVNLKPISVKALIASYKKRFKRNAQVVQTKIRGKIRENISKVHEKL